MSSVFENHIKYLAKVCPDIPFKAAIAMAEKLQQNSDDLSRQNFALLSLLELVGISDTGHLPVDLVEKALDTADAHTRRKYFYALWWAQGVHGGHSCGIPGYDISMKGYFDKYITGDSTTQRVIEGFEQNQKDYRKERQEEKRF